MDVYLSHFHVAEPTHKQSQRALLEWIIEAHTRSENTDNPAAFAEALRSDLLRIGLGDGKIESRSFEIDDCNHTDWANMEIYNLDCAKEGKHLGKRMELFNRFSMRAFDQFYSEASQLPPHLIHVTCTGYVAPSAAQQTVSRFRAGNRTQVTHAYHMGCYASIPAIRMALGHSSSHNESTDIVHTELSSLHMNPSLHSKEQLVIQSLFADGFIKYTLSKEPERASMLLHSILEEVIDDSAMNMTWTCHHWGFAMSISKEVPVRIRQAIKPYLKRLLQLSRKRIELKDAIFAIHPGGPKIIEQVANHLQLAPEQTAHSREVLRTRGNMSSATLPHVWDRILADSSIPAGTPVVSLAFGPGLSISGALLEKR